MYAVSNKCFRKCTFHCFLHTAPPKGKRKKSCQLKKSIKITLLNIIRTQQSKTVPQNSIEVDEFWSIAFVNLANNSRDVNIRAVKEKEKLRLHKRF